MDLEIKNVKDGKNGSRYYPRTHADAVLTNKGNSVQGELDIHEENLNELKQTVAELELTDEKVQEAKDAAIAAMQASNNAEQSASKAEEHAGNVDNALQEIIDSEISIEAGTIAQVAKNTSDLAELEQKVFNDDGSSRIDEQEEQINDLALKTETKSAMTTFVCKNWDTNSSNTNITHTINDNGLAIHKNNVQSGCRYGMNLGSFKGIVTVILDYNLSGGGFFELYKSNNIFVGSFVNIVKKQGSGKVQFELNTKEYSCIFVSANSIDINSTIEVSHITVLYNNDKNTVAIQRNYSLSDPTSSTFDGNKGIKLDVGEGNPVDLTPIQSGYNSYNPIIVDCSYGDTFLISGTGGSSFRLYGFVDSNNNLILSSGTEPITVPTIVIAPKRTAKMIINERTNAIIYRLPFYDGKTKLDLEDLTKESISNFESINNSLKIDDEAVSVDNVNVLWGSNNSEVETSIVDGVFTFLKTDNVPGYRRAVDLSVYGCRYVRVNLHYKVLGSGKCYISVMQSTVGSAVELMSKSGEGDFTTIVDTSNYRYIGFSINSLNVGDTLEISKLTCSYINNDADKLITRLQRNYCATNVGIKLDVGVGNVVDLAPLASGDNNYAPIVFNCKSGDKFLINGTGGYVYRLWAFVDSSNKLLKVSDTEPAVDLLVTAPDGASKLIINERTGKNQYYLPLIKDSEKEDVVDEFKTIYQSSIDSTCVKFSSNSEAGRVGYIWISDLHFNSNNEQNNAALLRQAKAICEIANSTAIDYVCIGGDVIDAEWNIDNVWKLMKSFIHELSNCRKPIVFISGNHDDNAYGSFIGKSAMKNMLIDNTIGVNPVYKSVNDCYFYFDLDSKRTRVVCLDYIDYRDGLDGRQWWSISTEQLKWFCEVAVNTSYNIIIMSHGAPFKEYNLYGLGDESGNMTALRNAIIAYNNRSSQVVIKGNTYDFANAEGKIMLGHSGHTHWDKDDVNVDGIPWIITACAKNETTVSNMTPVSGKADTYTTTQEQATTLHFNSYGFEFRKYKDRNYKTIREALFDVVSVGSEYVNVYRIGAGIDRRIGLN